MNNGLQIYIIDLIPAGFIYYKLRLFMRKRMLPGGCPNLNVERIRTEFIPFFEQSRLACKPHPFATASNVSRTCVTKSRVGRTTSARNRVMIRDDKIYRDEISYNKRYDHISRTSTIGRTYASVLPLPVGADTHKS